MKLKRRKNKKLLIILGIVAVVILLSLGIVAIVSNANAKKEAEEGKSIEQIIMSSYPDKIVYYLGEEFDPVGTRIQVITKGKIETYFVDYNELSFDGFDSSELSDSVKITVSYKGYTTSFDVRVIEPIKPAPTLVDIELYNFQTTYTLNDWNKKGPVVRGARIRGIYSDGSVVEDILLDRKFIYGVTKLDSAGRTEITIKYTDGVTVIEKAVTITVTN